jgi:hypothetical protein
MPNEHVNRFLGGPPLAVVGRLILLSILVGVILHAFGLDLWNILPRIQAVLGEIWDMGFDAVIRLWRYFLLGFVIVLPIWLILRVARMPKRG